MNTTNRLNIKYGSMINGNSYSKNSIVNWELHHQINKTSEKCRKYLYIDENKAFRIDVNGANKSKDPGDFMTE